MSRYINLSAADFIRAAGAGIAAVLTYFFGGADSWLIGLIVVVALDYISGVIAAIINGELSSRRGFIGILKKLLITFSSKFIFGYSISQPNSIESQRLVRFISALITA